MTTSENIIDQGSLLAKSMFTFNKDSSPWLPGDTKVMGLDRKALGQMFGVDGDASLFNVKSITVEPHHVPVTVSGSQAVFGVSLHHSKDVENPEPILTPTKYLYRESGNPISQIFHTVSSSNAHMSPHEIQIHPTEAALSAPDGLPFRRRVGWFKDGNLTGRDELKVGVHESKFGDDTKYILTPHGKLGNESPLHKFFMRNAESPKFHSGAYMAAKRAEVNHDGQTGIVVTKAHYDHARELLDKSLDVHSAAPFENGFYAHVKNLSDEVVENPFSLPMAFHRERISINPEKPFVTLTDLKNHIDGVESTNKAAPPPLAVKVHGKNAAKESAEVTLTSLEDIVE